MRLWGASNAGIYQVRLKIESIEQRLKDQITAWLKDGPDASVAKLNKAKGTLTPDEYHVGRNMILMRSANGSTAAAHK